MKMKVRFLWTRTGIIVVAILALLIQRWHYTAHPIERIRNTVDIVTKIVDRPVTEIIEKQTFIDKIVYKEVRSDPVIIERIDTVAVEIEKVPRVQLLGAEFEDEAGSVRVLVGEKIYTFAVVLATEGKTKIVAVDSATVVVRTQRFGLFNRLNLGYNADKQHTVGWEFLYVNRLWLIKDLRAGPQVGFEPKYDWRSTVGLHIGWQPVPERNNITIAGEFYLWPERTFTLGLQWTLFKY